MEHGPVERREGSWHRLFEVEPDAVPDTPDGPSPSPAVIPPAGAGADRVWAAVGTQGAQGARDPRFRSWTDTLRCYAGPTPP